TASIIFPFSPRLLAARPMLGSKQDVEREPARPMLGSNQDAGREPARPMLGSNQDAGREPARPMLGSNQDAGREPARCVRARGSSPLARRTGQKPFDSNRTRLGHSSLQSHARWV